MPRLIACSRARTQLKFHRSTAPTPATTPASATAAGGTMATTTTMNTSGSTSMTIVRRTVSLAG